MIELHLQKTYFDLIKEGEFKDHIIVNRSYIKKNEGRQWSNWLIDFDGKEIKDCEVIELTK